MLLFCEKNANFEFWFDCRGASNPQNRLGSGLIGNFVVEFGISCVGIFPLAAGALSALWSNVFCETRFSGW
jgi:hypothetical protein